VRWPRVERPVVWLVFWLALALTSALVRAAGGGEGDLRVVSWNVANYLSCNRMTAAGFRIEYPKPEAEKAALRAMIARLHPDVLVLQEMGGEAHLRELRRDLAAEGVDFAGGWCVVEADDGVRHLAVLWRAGVRVQARAADLGSGTIKRGLLEMELRVAGQRLHLFGTHLKSRYTVDAADLQACVQRARELDAVLGAIAARVDARQEPVLLLGDFNSGPGTEDWTDMQRRVEAASLRRIDARDAEGEDWTLVWDAGRRREVFDHVFVSSRLEAPEAPLRVTACVADMTDAPAPSDHRPLVVDLVWHGTE